MRDAAAVAMADGARDAAAVPVATLSRLAQPLCKLASAQLSAPTTSCQTMTPPSPVAVR